MHSFKAKLKQLWFPKVFRLPEPEFTKEQVDLLEELIQLIHPTLSKVEEVHRDDKMHMAHFLVDLGTGIWRIRRKIEGLTRMPKEIRDALYSLESTWMSMSEGGVQIVDHIGTIPSRSEAKIVEVRDIPNLPREQVVDAIRPTILLKGEVIQLGEVVMGRPARAYGAEESVPELAEAPEIEPIEAEPAEMERIEAEMVTNPPEEVPEMPPVAAVFAMDEAAEDGPRITHEVETIAIEIPEAPEVAESVVSAAADAVEAEMPEIAAEPSVSEVVEIETPVVEAGKTDGTFAEVAIVGPSAMEMEPRVEMAEIVENGLADVSLSGPEEQEQEAASPVETTDTTVPEVLETPSEDEAKEAENALLMDAEILESAVLEELAGLSFNTPLIEETPPVAEEPALMEVLPEGEPAEAMVEDILFADEQPVGAQEAAMDDGFVRDVPTALEEAIIKGEVGVVEFETDPAAEEKPKKKKAARKPKAEETHAENEETDDTSKPKRKKRTAKKTAEVTEADHVG